MIRKTIAPPAPVRAHHKNKKNIYTPLQHQLKALIKALFEQKREIEAIQREVSSLETAQTLKPSLFQKLKKLLSQISTLRLKEESILFQIGDVERRHALLRKSNKLKKAMPAPHPTKGQLKDEEKKRLHYDPQGFLTGTKLANLFSFHKRKRNQETHDM